MPLSSRRSGRSGGSSDFDSVLVDFAGRVTLRCSLDGRTATFRAPDVQQLTASAAGSRIQYFAPSAGKVNAALALGVEDVRRAFLLDYGRCPWERG